LIHDLETDRYEARSHADVCIVGAGAAGIALAVELKRLGRSVLLLEGGGRLVEERAQTPYVSEIELTPYYQRAIQVEGLEGALLEDNLVWAALGMEQPQFAQLCISLSRWCPEPNFALLHKAALEGDGIEVWLHANAVQLLLEGEQVRGVRCRTQGDVEAVFTAAEYCFCLGAIESSRFFLQPREGGLPWNSSGLLGMHFQDHVDCTAATVKPLPGGAFHANFDTVFLHGYKYNPKLTLDEATQRTQGLLQAGATFFSKDSDVEVLTRVKGTVKKLLSGRLGEIDGAGAWCSPAQVILAF
jgi:choline dehydrogenase-like flavoprotein